MSKRFIFPTLCFSFLLLFGAGKANADATFSTSALTCSSFRATGTVTAAYVAVRVWNLTDGQFEGGPALIDSFFDVGAPTAYFPATGGAFSFTVNFPQQDTGDVIRARIYATDSPAFGAWDGGTFPEIEGACASASTIPTLGPAAIATLAAFLALSGFALLRFVPGKT
jgi:hypothetical protein